MEISCPHITALKVFHIIGTATLKSELSSKNGLISEIIRGLNNSSLIRDLFKLGPLSSVT